MAHVALIDRPRGLIPGLALRYSRRKLGEVVEPVAAAAHHSGVLVAMGALETAVERGWKRLDPHLRWLAQASAGQIGCSWCTDFGYYDRHQLLEELTPVERAAFLLREVFGYDTTRNWPGCWRRARRTAGSWSAGPSSTWRDAGRASTPTGS